MRTVNPAVIPRNHRVEEALSAAEEHDDLSVLHRLLAALASPYEARADLAEYQDPPPTIATTEHSAERRRSATEGCGRVSAVSRRAHG